MLLVARTVEAGVILLVASATDVGLKTPVSPPCAVLIRVLPVVATITAAPLLKIRLAIGIGGRAEVAGGSRPGVRDTAPCACVACRA